ncbi:hypothetical protein [Rheinheimera sp. MMS21-TC3]|uniref:hypothetical protein n=1 Tax=Rheinheimera sp. MMS21-TC3 TaxID=3072790 RepID=UPI0028C39AED|nr:hypothetical protein [Rheinheimera sp. MMS21-TC3]WNO59482.1 hypothetical protein RDV63_00505 [Rheinheimera sp. MMS21-TC3]
MKFLLPLLTVFMLMGCQITQPEPTNSTPEIASNLPELTATTEPQIEQISSLTISDSPESLLAWVEFRAQLLNQAANEREQLNQLDTTDDVTELKRIILQLHPDTPYLTRLRLQMQLSEKLALLPNPLANLLSWDFAFNQKLLETESAVSALTRLNAQQQNNIDKLRKTNKELQKKIDALTQIEAQLNQPTIEVNNGQP